MAKTVPLDLSDLQNEKPEWKLNIRWEDLPGFEWSDCFRNEAAMKEKISDTINYVGDGWYPAPEFRGKPNKEISLILVRDGFFHFYHFSDDPRGYKFVVEVPSFDYPTR